MKYLKTIIFLLLVVLPLVFSRAPLLAQTGNEPTAFENVKLWIKPEYDDPWLLVMMEGQIAGAEPPARVRFLVPSEAKMYSAGSMDAQGQYSGGPPDRKLSEIPGWDEISYEVKTATFRVEYYAPSITGQKDKTISYEFLRLLPIDRLQVVVQQPRSSANFTVSPAGQLHVDADGFNTLNYVFSNLATNDPVSFTISYTKSDPRPSLEITGEITGQDAPANRWWIGIVAGAVILAVILFFFIRKKPKANNRAARRRETSGRREKPGEPGTRFCPDCGKPVRPSDKFCPNCGARL